MKKGLLMVLVLAIVAFGATANAAVFGKGKFQFSAGLRQLTMYTVDTVFSGVSDNAVMGFGADFKYGMSEDWALNWGGFYGFGNQKFEDNLAFGSGTSLNLKVTGFGFYGGVERTVNIGDNVGLYMGPGIEWVSAKAKADFSPGPPTEWSNPSASTFSLVGKLGGEAMMGEHFGINANIGQKWSHPSWDHTVGGGSGKVSGWTSSLDGFAGFTFFIN